MKIVNRYFKVFLVLLALGLVASCNYDDDMEAPNYVSFQFSPVGANVGVPVDGSTTYEAKVYTADIVDQDRQFDVVVNSSSTLGAEAYNIPATVTVPAGSNEGTVTVDVSDVNLGVSGKKLVLNIQKTGEVSVGDPLTLNVSRTCPGKEFVIDFQFDGYASETSWEIFDAAGNSVVEGGGYVDDQPSASRSLCLSAGDYTFEVKDSYGDGLTYPNLGSVTLSYAGQVIATISGDYNEGTSVDFTL